MFRIGEGAIALGGFLKGDNTELDKVAVALLHVARPPVSEHSMYLIFLLSLKSGVRKYCEPVKNQRNMFESGIRKKTLYLNTRDSPFIDTFS